MLDSRELDQLLAFQLRSPGEDELGQPNGAWTTVFSWWAKAVTFQSGETPAEGQMQARTPITFYGRYRTGFDVAMRILWRGVPYEMVGEPVDIGGAREKLRIEAVKGVRDGR